MKLYYRGRNKTLIKTYNVANQILNSPEFYEQISAHTSFDNTKPADLSPANISDLLRNHKPKVYIKTYRARWGANAKTKRSTHFKINVRKLNRDHDDIVETMIHEYVHCVDFYHKEYRFTHHDNDNSHGDENNTAPWAIGLIAKEMAAQILANSKINHSV